MPQSVAKGAKVQCFVKGPCKEMQVSPPITPDAVLSRIGADQPVLIAGPTASGKSALALALAESHGGVIINADASQVYRCWRVISARPSEAEESRAPHALYGHVAAETPYSVGHWLREVDAVLAQGQRPIIVGGTGLYFTALTKGLAEIPATPDVIRDDGNTLTLEQLTAALDVTTAGRIDLNNRARVQRAWEVLQATGRGLANWQDDTPPPLLALDRCAAIAVNADKDWLNARIVQRFDQMLAQGALDEVASIRPSYDPALPAHRAIGVPELIRYLDGLCSLDVARADAIIATRQYAKRQRTWMRNNTETWIAYQPG